MILVDTSVWIDHLHGRDAFLASLLESAGVCTHPMVAGELAMGSLRNRESFLGPMADLPPTIVASHEEVMMLVDGERLHGRGLSLVDAHLLASTRLTPGTLLWTRDKRLAAVAAELGVAFAGCR